MNKQELIDKAVVRFKGKWPVCDPTNLNVLQYAPDLDGTTYYPYYFHYAHEHNDLCTREEFENRARELGWVNGYQYGVEYETNGEKPDLDDDVVVEFKNKHGLWNVMGKGSVAFWAWHFGVAFRIVDDRFKPKQTPMPVQNTEQDNSWHERGELPPAGTICECFDYSHWQRALILCRDGNSAWVRLAEDDRVTKSDPSDFRPIKSDREKFIDAASDVMRGTSVVITGSAQFEICAALFDAGFRAPSDKG